MRKAIHETYEDLQHGNMNFDTREADQSMWDQTVNILGILIQKVEELESQVNPYEKQQNRITDKARRLVKDSTINCTDANREADEAAQEAYDKVTANLQGAWLEESPATVDEAMSEQLAAINQQTEQRNKEIWSRDN